MSRSALVVLGMHRSGTSAFAGAMSHLGVPLGRGLMPPAGDNARGFFENPRVCELDDAMLKVVGSAWDSPFPLPEGWWRDESLAPLKADVAAWLAAEFDGRDVFAVKDPRLCRLFPVWREAFEAAGIEPRFILPVRHPLEVARSLRARDGFSIEKAALLWIDHVLEAERHSRGSVRAFSAYDDLLRDPGRTLRDVARRLGIDYPRSLEEAAAEIAPFVNRGLKHQDAESRGSEAELRPEVLECHRLLLDLARGVPDDASAAAAWDEVRAEFAAARDFFYGPEVRGIERRDRWDERRARERDRRIADLEAQLAGEKRVVAGLIGSTSWRATAPARAAGTWVRTSVRRGSRSALDGLRSFYQKLPLSPAVRSRVRHRALGILGFLRAKPSADRSAPAGSAFAGTTRAGGVLEFDRPAKPLVSVIVPAFGHSELTRRCLESLLDVRGEAAFEVLVVNDASPDDTPEMLAGIRGLTVIRNETNLGFLRSCNAAAERASGGFLVFLNNDATVRPGWLSALLETFQTFPDAGVAGSKVLFPEGLLQEAGGIVWRDGSASHYGRMDDPRRGRYRFAREVDYCSGASLMIPRELFRSLGGFDPVYAPAYYEDVDLAFRVRAAGRKVYVQPNSEIVHHEGATSGTDVSSGVKRYQEINRDKFRARWSAELAARPARGEPLETAAERPARMRVLVVDECVCRPDRDAGSLRMDAILDILRDMGARVTFVPANGGYPEPYTARLRGRGVDVLEPSDPRALRSFLRARGTAIDAAILSRQPVAARSIDLVRRSCPRARVVFDTVDLHFLRERREAEAKGDAALARAAERTRRAELDVAAKADVTLVVSAEEKRVLDREAPGLRVEVVSTIQPLSGTPAPFAERGGLLFVGGFGFPPNVDAVTFFAVEILPLVRRRLPGVRFHVVGSDPPREVRALESDDVLVHGFVQDLEPLLRTCRVSVAPLRWGAGVKGKINLSMSRGLPVVATSLAAEGMSLTPGEDVLTADDPEGFAAAVAALHTDEALWNRLSANGRENVRTHFSVEAAREALARVLERPGAPERLARRDPVAA